ncbi:MAG TPA: AAA family ATPase, partial [Acidimicrobiales bacterium]|nr:AAA family ATPase [Acidimicrobiales bacterium]
MLTELRVEQLGVIDELRLVLEPGLTVLTGETGAGKTLVVEALELLLGGRADQTMVRAGADEAVVEGRFVLARPAPGDVPGDVPGVREGDGGERAAAAQPIAGDDLEEVVLARALPRSGRGRSYLDGRMAPLAALAEAGADLADLHGQHSHQSLLRPAAQRGALDRFAGVDLSA